MLSILSEPLAGPAKQELRAPLQEEASAVPVSGSAPTPDSPEEFEIVMGRGQIAGVAFLVTVIVAILSSVSYVAGKSMSPRKADQPVIVDARPVSSQTAPASPANPAIPSIPMIEATLASSAVARPKLPGAQATSKEEFADAPIFAEPTIGAVYLQMAAVEKPNAVIFADGLRVHGLRAFVAPGPDVRIFRVLIGPLPTPASFERAKEVLDKIGLTTFARKYEK